MEYLAPIVAGVACGAFAGAPYAVAMRVAKRSREASILPAVVAVCASILVIALSVLLGWVFLRDVLVIFAVTLVLMFLAIVVVSVVLFGRRPRS